MLKVDDRNRKVLIPDNLKRYIDLNVDFGQNRDQAFFKSTDYALLNYASSINVPCCVHDGDPRDVLAALELGKKHNCAVGAHVGYPDPTHGGYQRPEGLTDEDLAAWLRVQMGAFNELAKVHMVDVLHVRPHGALYTALINDEKTSLVLAETLKQINSWIILVGPAGPVLDKVAAETGIRTAPEIYLGKRYTDDGLPDVNRLHETMPAQSAFDQAKRLIENNSLTSAGGKDLPVKFKSLHISPAMDGAVELAEKVSQLLVQPVPLTMLDVAKSGW